jgi:ATP synthase F1 delta subunit
MKNPILVKRYVEGLSGALASPAEYEAVRRELEEFSAQLSGHDGLRRALLQPFVGASKKEAIIEEVLDRMKVRDKTRRLLRLLLHHGRLEILPRILEGLPDSWRGSQGVRSFEVRSVLPLTPAQKKRLEGRLEKLESGPVHCRYAIDPALVGGLTVCRGNLVFDVSLKGQLERLKDTISER